MKKKWLMMLLAMITLMIYPVSAFAADGPTNVDLQVGLDTAFTFLKIHFSILYASRVCNARSGFGSDEECRARSR